LTTTGFFRESVGSTYFRKFCRNNKNEKKKKKKKKKKKNWDNSDVALLPRQNCPRFFFFFEEKNSFKKERRPFVFQYKLLTCYVEEIKHGVDRSLRPGQPCRK
jgi:hypothetical protein